MVRHIATRVAVMYLGKIVELADRENAFRGPVAPLHQGAAISGARNLTPHLPAIQNRIILQGDVPSPSKPTKGLQFLYALPGNDGHM